MSTKTTFKRIALVVVAALGFGLLTQGPAANAAYAATNTSAAGVLTLTNTDTTIAGRIGQQVSITINATAGLVTTGAGAIPTTSVAAVINSQPAGSAVYPTLACVAAIEAGTTDYDNCSTDRSSTGGSGSLPGRYFFDTAGATTTTIAGTATYPATINYSMDTGEDAEATTVAGSVATLTFTPTTAGVYTVTVWNENDRTVANVTDHTAPAAYMLAGSNAALSGAESYKVFSIIVGSGVSNVAISAVGGSTSAKGGANGSLVKICTTDAAGNIAIPATGETVTLTPSGTADIATVNGGTVASTAGAAYNLSAASFAASTGCSYVNITNAAAETVSIVASMTGIAAKTLSLTYRTLTVAAAQPAVYSASATGYLATGGRLVELPIGANTTTFRLAGTYVADAPKYFGVMVTDTTGYVTGLVGTSLAYDHAATLGTTHASFNVTSGSTATAQVLYSIEGLDASGAALTESPVAVKSLTTAAGSSLTVTPSAISAIPGASVVIKVTAVDVFGRAYANQTISATSTGRNVRSIATAALTNADGVASFTFTDAATTSALLSDAISFTGAGTGSATVTYSTSNVAGTITLTSTGDTDVVAGTTVTDISTAYTGAEASYATASAVVKNAAGSVVAGAPVTFVVTGLTGAEVHTTTATVYTDATGTAVGNVSSYATGKATITATSGTATATDDLYFAQTTDTDARTISAVVSGNVVTATVKDRFGNVVRGATVWATRTGTAYFGNGSGSSSGATGLAGTVDFIVTGAGTVTVQLGSATAASATFGQSANAAGYIGNGTAALAVDAYVAGTSTANQEGLGGSLSPVGVNSVTVTVDVANATADASQAAADAAAEATDAANAATDAANAAAEAADAATAAAQDAADAVAALSAQVASLVASIKAQITSLTALIVKIQKKVKA